MSKKSQKGLEPISVQKPGGDDEENLSSTPEHRVPEFVKEMATKE